MRSRLSDISYVGTIFALVTALAALSYQYISLDPTELPSNKAHFTPVETIALWALFVAVFGHIINFYFSLRRDFRESRKELSDADKAREKDERIKELEIANAVLKTKLEYESREKLDSQKEKKELLPRTKDRLVLSPKEEE